MSSERYRGYDRVFLSRTTGPSYAVVVRGSDHYNYTDTCLIDPTHAMVGEIKPVRMLSIINAYVLAFLDRYLKEETNPLLDGPSSDYPEVTITIRSGG
jgi:hypothetical protein